MFQTVRLVNNIKYELKIFIIKNSINQFNWYQFLQKLSNIKVINLINIFFAIMDYT
jgi:hypothetical protein